MRTGYQVRKLEEGKKLDIIRVFDILWTHLQKVDDFLLHCIEPQLGHVILKSSNSLHTAPAGLPTLCRCVLHSQNTLLFHSPRQHCAAKKVVAAVASLCCTSWSLTSRKMFKNVLCFLTATCAICLLNFILSVKLKPKALYLHTLAVKNPSLDQ